MEYFEDEELLEKRGKTKKTVKKVVIILAFTIGIFFIFCYILHRYAVPVDYRKFDPARINSIENEYMISLDNVEPERYYKPRLAQDTISCFDFYTDDYRAFMDSFHGEKIVRSCEEPDGSYASFKCHVRDKYCFSVDFTRENGRYKGKLSYYTDVSYYPSQPETDYNGASYTIIWE